MCRLVILLLTLLVQLTSAFCPDGLPCVRKCCPIGHMVMRRNCTPGGEELEADEGVTVVHARPKCQMYVLREDENHTIHHNGTVTFDDGGSAEYCRDYTHLNMTLTFVCFPPDDEAVEQEKKKLQLYSLGLWVSQPFLLITILVYACLKRLRNLHGMCIIFHSASMLMSYITLAMVQNALLEQQPECTILGYAIQFFFMATFFWLNVMCFDIYWAFSGLKNLTGSVTERERKKLILYSFYAWGFPLLILLVTVGIDFSPYVPANSIFKPKVGVDKCFFKETVATGIYFYMPMGLIIVNNIFLFSVTAYRICTLRRETAVLKRGDSRKHDSTNDKERFSLYLKLFLVMGINWVMELVSFLAGGPEIIWYIPDFTNTLQGVFIFIIFVWKKRVRRLVWAKLTNCCGKKTMSESTKSPWTASTRNTSSHTTTSGVSHNSIKMTPVTTATNGDVSQAAVA